MTDALTKALLERAAAVFYDAGGLGAPLNLHVEPDPMNARWRIRLTVGSPPTHGAIFTWTDEVEHSSSRVHVLHAGCTRAAQELAQAVSTKYRRVGAVPTSAGMYNALGEAVGPPSPIWHEGTQPAQHRRAAVQPPAPPLPPKQPEPPRERFALLREEMDDG